MDQKQRTIINTFNEEDVFVLSREYDKGGQVLLMKGLDKSKPDYRDLLVIADCFARLGKKVLVLNSLHYKDPMYHYVFGNLIGTRYYRKCPDLLVDDTFYEYESYNRPWNKKKIQRMISNGLRQSSYIIIDNNKGAVDRHIKKLIQARLNLNAPIDEVWIYEKGTIRPIYKNNREDKPSLRGNAP